MNKKTKKRTTLKETLKNELKDSDFSFHYKQEQAINDIARMIRNARLKLGFTQAQLAKRAGTTQTVVARLESGTDGRTPSLDLLGRLAHALRTQLCVDLRPETRAH